MEELKKDSSGLSDRPKPECQELVAINKVDVQSVSIDGPGVSTLNRYTTVDKDTKLSKDLTPVTEKEIINMQTSSKVHEAGAGGDCVMNSLVTDVQVDSTSARISDLSINDASLGQLSSSSPSSAAPPSAASETKKLSKNKLRKEKRGYKKEKESNTNKDESGTEKKKINAITNVLNNNYESHAGEIKTSKMRKDIANSGYNQLKFSMGHGDWQQRSEAAAILEQFSESNRDSKQPSSAEKPKQDKARPSSTASPKPNHNLPNSDKKKNSKKGGSTDKSKQDGGKGHRGQHGQQHSQGQQNNNQQLKFESYWSRERISAGLKRGELIEGPIRINPKNYEESYVPLPDGKSDVFISGMKARNRALNDDIVVVQLETREKWRVHEKNLERYEAVAKSAAHGNSKRGNSKGGNSHNESSGEDSGPDVVIESEEIVYKGNPQASEDGGRQAKKGKITALVEEVNRSKRTTSYLSVEEVMSNGSPAAKNLFKPKGTTNKDTDSIVQKVGKVVAILERKHSRAASGHLKPSKIKDMAFFSPFDYRLPRILIPLSECPKDFCERPNDYASILYIAKIVKWDEGSVYAKGELSRSLGEAGLIEPETEALLIENGVDYSEFSDQVLACLPKDLPWRIPAGEFSYRRDFRKECVFTIDPATARDLDDAVSCRSLGDGMYEVGVHIADVSYFIQPDSPLDTVAAQRATSVYLTQKVIPMLPRLLCEQLCSLNPDEDRLTFSVCWKMNEKGEVFEEWFGRSIIRSCVKLSYNHAQGFIDFPDKEWSREELPPISEGFSVEDIKSRTLILYKMSQCLRQVRFDQGALRLDQVKLQFTLDDETGLPNGYSVYQQRESNRLIEEFMLLANMAVAHKINENFPKKAILRCHPPPQTKMIEDLQKTCQEMGIKLDITSSHTIHKSIRRYIGNDEFTVGRMQVLVALCSKPMQRAKYFCAGTYDDENDYHHYALNVPLYTHFTSPIRRYPDVMVHRLLAASLGYCEAPAKDIKELQREAIICNDKKTNAKRCSEISNDIFFSVFVKEAGPLHERGMVMAVFDRAFDVFILKLGVTKRVYCDKLGIVNHTYDKSGPVAKLNLMWPPLDNQSAPVNQEIAVFSLVNCVLMALNEPLKWMAIIKRPSQSVPA